MSDCCKNDVCENNSMINGNSIDVVLNGCDSEVKADIVVSEYNSIRIWGQVKSCDGQVVPYALLKLVKVVKTCNGCEYQGIAHTVSDCEGFYQFDICIDTEAAGYKILVGKSSTGPERLIMSGDGNCQACTNPDTNYNPCGAYQYRVTPADKINCYPPSGCSCNNGGCSQTTQQSCTNYCGSCQNTSSGQGCQCQSDCGQKSNHMSGSIYAPSKIRC